MEVVVVDDGSTDGTIERLRAMNLPGALRVLEQPHRGPAEARNLGVEHAVGDLVLFLDDDVVPGPGLVATHVATHAAQPDTVVIGPMLPPEDDSRTVSVWVRWEEEQLLAQYQDMAAGRYDCGPRQLYTGNASISRERFRAAGGFDTRFQRAEDVELGYRLRDAGSRFVFNPEAPVQHYASRTFESWSRTPYLYGRYDVVMHRDKGHEALPLAFVEFHYRHRLNRALIRVALRNRWTARRLLPGLVLGMSTLARAAGRVGAWGPAVLALSGIFNLRYWQGACDELGGPERLWPEIRVGRRGAHAGMTPTPEAVADTTGAPV
jgi:GT2 family glycosyltransferase